MAPRNWKIINANRKKRWESMDEAGKLQMLEEAELSKKANILKGLMNERSGEYTLTLKELTRTTSSIMRLLEWGFEVQWGIRIELTKYPGVRFKKLEGCAEIINASDPKVKAKLGLISQEAASAQKAISTALEAIRAKNPEAAALVNALLAKEAK